MKVKQKKERAVKDNRVIKILHGSSSQVHFILFFCFSTYICFGHQPDSHQLALDTLRGRGAGGTCCVHMRSTGSLIWCFLRWLYFIFPQWSQVDLFIRCVTSIRPQQDIEAKSAVCHRPTVSQVVDLNFTAT